MEKFVNKRIKIIKMVEETEPVAGGTWGTIVHFGGGVLDVTWDNGRTLGVIADKDIYQIYDGDTRIK